jgi:hypothetical protein
MMSVELSLINPNPAALLKQGLWGIALMHACAWVFTRQVRPCGGDQGLYKHVLQEGDSFETARPPFQVGIFCC